MGVLVAIYGFLQSPLGQALVVVPVATWLVKKVRGDKRADAFTRYAMLAFQAVEPMGIPSLEKYKRAVGFVVDSMKKGGYGMPTAKEMTLFEELAKQFALSKKPAGK